jgi:hypothetical protein
MSSPCSLCVCMYILPVNFWMPEPVYMKFGMYEGISISKGKLCCIEMHLTYTDPNKMLLFQ